MCVWVPKLPAAKPAKSASRAKSMWCRTAIYSTSALTYNQRYLPCLWMSGCSVSSRTNAGEVVLVQLPRFFVVKRLIFIVDSYNSMDCGKVIIKHPAIPDGFIIVSLLLCIMMANSEIIGNIKDVIFIFFIHMRFY